MSKISNLFRGIVALALAFIVSLPSGSAWAMDTAYHSPVGPYQTIVYQGSDMALPANTALAASGTDTGTLIVSNGIRDLSASVVASHAWSATLTTYMDAAGSVTQEAVTVTGSGNAAGVLRSTVDRPFASFKIAITDTAATTSACSVRMAIGQN
jgi:hypothetical protein